MHYPVLINTFEGIASKNESDNFDVDLYNTSSFLSKFADNTKTGKHEQRNSIAISPNCPPFIGFPITRFR